MKKQAVFFIIISAANICAASEDKPKVIRSCFEMIFGRIENALEASQTAHDNYRKCIKKQPELFIFKRKLKDKTIINATTEDATFECTSFSKNDVCCVITPHRVDYEPKIKDKELWKALENLCPEESQQASPPLNKRSAFVHYVKDSSK